MFQNRPLVLDTGLQVNPTFGIVKIKGVDAGYALQLHGSLGLLGLLEVGINTSFQIHPAGDWNRDFVLGASTGVLSTALVDLAPKLEIPLNFKSGAKKLNTAIISASTRIKLTDQISILAGDAFLPIQFDPMTLYAAVNVGLGFQANDQLGLRLDTTLANIKLKDDAGTTTHLGDATPVTITAIYAGSEMLDLVLIVGTADVQNFDTIINVNIGAQINL